MYILNNRQCLCKNFIVLIKSLCLGISLDIQWFLLHYSSFESIEKCLNVFSLSLDIEEIFL